MSYLKFGRLTRINRIWGVDVYVHWSVFLVSAFFLLNAGRKPLLTVIGLAAYWSILLIHECGHLIAAQRLNCEVYSIELYPVFGFTRFQTPWSQFDHTIIAWGGVLAQATVAFPVVLWVALRGYTRYDAVNALLAILGFLSLGIAAFNLIPTGSLDGKLAWQIFPLLIKRLRDRRTKRPVKWRQG
jgi:hypothetical protein